MDEKVFISYSHADQAFVHRLAQDLKSSGVNVFLDEWEIEIGDSISDKIAKNIESSKYFCIILSSNSINSEWVKRELKAALGKAINDKESKILPIKIDDCKVPLFLQDTMHANFKEHLNIQQYNNSFNKLLRSIDKSKIFSQNLVKHKIYVVTGVTSSGKDSLMTDSFNKKLKFRNDFFFLTKYISRTPRGEEMSVGEKGQRLVPYLVKKVNRMELELNSKKKYFSVYEKYGYYFGFDINELENVLLSTKNTKLIFIQPDLDKIKIHINELTDKVKSIENNLKRTLGKDVDIAIEKVLVDCPPNDCRFRLYRRGLNEQVRIRREMLINDDYIIAKALKEENYFEFVIDNSGATPNNRSTDEFLQIVLNE